MEVCGAWCMMPDAAARRCSHNSQQGYNWVATGKDNHPKILKHIAVSSSYYCIAQLPCERKQKTCCESMLTNFRIRLDTCVWKTIIKLGPTRDSRIVNSELIHQLIITCWYWEWEARAFGKFGIKIAAQSSQPSN